MQANYYINVINYSTGSIISMIAAAETSSLRYRRALDGVGTAQFTISGTHTAAEYIVKHAWFEIYRCSSISTCEREGTFMVVSITRHVDEKDREWLLVGGVSMEFLLQQRIIDPRNDSGGGGWSTKSGPVDTVMAELVEEQAGPSATAHSPTPSQRVTGLTIVTPSGTGDTVAIREQWTNLLKVLQQLSENDQMDFYIKRSSGTSLEFYAERVGSDKTVTTNAPGGNVVLLSPELGRLRRVKHTRDWKKEATVVYLMGRGAGGYRDLYGTVASNNNETPYSYSAIVQDARNAETIAEYVTQATAALAKSTLSETLSFVVDDAASQYHTLWNLGDFVTVSWGDIKQDMRIVDIQVRVNQNGEAITPKLRKRYANS